MQCFTNNIPQRDGGTHLAGFRAALTRVVTKYADELVGKKDKVALTGEDCREGLTCVLSVKVPDPKFSSQTKDKLVSSEVRPVSGRRDSRAAGRMVRGASVRGQNGRAESDRGGAGARSCAQGARIDASAKARWTAIHYPANWPIARSAIRQNASCSWWRAILQAVRQNRAATAPIRRSCRCAAKSSMWSARATDKMLSSQEVVTLITALGTSIREEFNADKLRYHKIIIMTDADVDGAHIRTLLLTFFYRQMKELIERGHIFIAQPPLYKASRGKSERYLKDERELEEHLMAEGLKDCVLTLSSGEHIAGADLAHLVERARVARAALDGFPAALSTIPAGAGGDCRRPQSRIAVRSRTRGGGGGLHRAPAGLLSDETERGWNGEPTPDGGLRFRREVRGVTETIAIDGALIASADARKLDRMAGELQATYLKSGELKRKDDTREVRAPTQLLDAVLQWGRQGLSLQRYKGLGEMNPSQLWETTLDENARTLLAGESRTCR